MGKEFTGTQRNSYLINPESIVAKEYRSVNPLSHFKQILTDLDQLLS
jgi:peroxiredoxin